MSKLFNAQNLNQRKTKYQTVWLNIKNPSCSSWEFIGVTSGGVVGQATSRDFGYAKYRKINYAYAGGINECDYKESLTTDRNNNPTFLFELNKVSITSGQYTYQLYNTAKAAFMQGSPVIHISVRIIPGEADIIFTPMSTSYLASIKAESELHIDSQEVEPGYIPEDLGNGTKMWWKVPEYINGQTERSLSQSDLYNIGQAAGPASLTRIHWDMLTQMHYEIEYPVLAWFPRFGFVGGTTPVWSVYAFLYDSENPNPNAFVFDLDDPEPSGSTLYRADKVGPSGVFTPSQGEWSGISYLGMIIS